MPSDRVYSTLVDHNGYLWIATAKGVVKYNGYDFKTFTINDGLPTNDVWQLLEDAKGRIWLGCIANKLGYIYREKYKDAIFKDGEPNTVYPSHMQLYDGHIHFFCHNKTSSLHNSYYIEQDDTLYNYDLYKKIKEFNPSVEASGSDIQTINAIANEKGDKIVIYDSQLYTFNVNHKQLMMREQCNSLISNRILGSNYYNFIDDYLLLTFHDYRKYFEVYDIKNCKKYQENLKDINIDENIISMFWDRGSPNNKLLDIYTYNHILRYDIGNGIKCVDTISVKSFLGNDFNGYNINSFSQDRFWKTNIGTTKGLKMIHDLVKQKFVRQETLNLLGYEHLGSCKNVQLWINDQNSIYIFDTSLKLKQRHLFDGKEPLYSATQRNTKEIFLVGKTNYIYNIKTGAISRLPDDVMGVSIFKLIYNPGTLSYCINNSGFYSVNLDSGVVSRRYLYNGRFKDMQYDSLENTYWVYSDNKILTYSRQSLSIYDQQHLKNFGISRVEKIAVDNMFGNIFLKGNDKIILFDKSKRTYQYLFSFLNHSESSISLYNNVLIVYGPFGILFSKVLAHNKLSPPIIYWNARNSIYKSIHDVQVFAGKVLISSNTGVFTVDIPITDSAYETGQNSIDYKLVCYSRDRIKNLHNGDTIKISKDDQIIRFDVINPLASGKITYTITAMDKTIILNGSEFVLPSSMQSPDNYYIVTLSVNDRIWYSAPIKIVVYMVPYWWQTKTMTKILWIAAIISTFLLFLLAILITRRLVLRANQKRNARMELELKSIYAQINPHFIFNSLNSALLLVSKGKTDDAYIHISKFSRLLRSYIKSSRNKMILLSDEIKNLTNYIDLQQVRFKDKFSYSIAVGNQVDSNNIHIPSLLLQPFVENAIEHGLLNKIEPGNLTISFNKGNNNTLVCIIEDDGIGRKESKLNKIPNPIKDESYGELLIKDLVSIFNRYEKMNINVSYADKEPPLTGTIVTIVINLNANRS